MAGFGHRGLPTRRLSLSFVTESEVNTLSTTLDYPRTATVKRLLTSSGVRGVLIAALLVVASVLIGHAASVNRGLHTALQTQHAAASRTAIHDRLIGQPLPHSLLNHLQIRPTAPRGVARSHLLWIVDGDRCGGCLADGLPMWSELAGDSLLDRHVILVGQALSGTQRHEVRGNVTVMAREKISEALGTLLPNTKILTDDQGIILMADSRFTGPECGWSFDAQVGALRGILATDLLRDPSTS